MDRALSFFVRPVQQTPVLLRKTTNKKIYAMRRNVDTRQEALKKWLESHLQAPIQLQPVVGDASFRRYFRLHHQAQPFIAMDSPPEKEDCKPFITIAHRLAKLNLDMPKILESDDAEGFLLLSDLGNELYQIGRAS